MTSLAKSRHRVVILFLALFTWTGLCPGYSVLTHEQIVDILWIDRIQPLLRKRFPQATDDDLRKAHAYAYGGSMIQDMGYYPFGNKYFSDLVHYVRSGDFVQALIQDSSDINEYAFALGALSHYAADNSGHPAINHVVAIEFPTLRAKYGENVTYADDPKAHIRTEFGFDMAQVAKNRYTSDQYHDFIGFAVAKPLLERAFFDTYQLHLEDVFRDVDLAIGSFRRAVSKLIPEMTRVALLSRKKQLVRDTPNFSEKKFRYYLSRAQYEKQWGSVYRRPGSGARVLAFFLRLVPKVGPFQAVSFKIPTTQTEDLYVKSVDLTVESYAKLLKEARDQRFDLPNIDCDTGKATRAGEYKLTDDTYARLLDQQAQKGMDQVSPDLKQNILTFYADLKAPIATKRNKKAWQKTMAEVEKLKSSPAEGGPTPATSPTTAPAD